MIRLRGMLWKPGCNGLGVGPRWMRWWLPYRKRFHEAALLHDAEYDESGGWRDRREYDVLFLQKMVEASETTLQVTFAVIYFYAVRLFGWLFYNYNNNSKNNSTMKKILKVWDNFADWVCKFSGDKYVHLIVGLIIAFVFAWLLGVTTKGFPAINYAVCSVIAAGVAMLLKEVCDFMRGENFDGKDIVFGLIGGIIGALLYLL